MEQERREKHYFKRSLSLLMSLMMIVSVFSGLNISVYAENGPYTYTDADMTEEDFSDYNQSCVFFYDHSKFESEVFFYPELSDATIPTELNGISYDLETNTLTLNNVVEPTGFLNFCNMGDDFKIEVIGYNEINGIRSYALRRGSSITLTGDGEIVINNSKTQARSIYMYSYNSAPLFKVEENVELTVYVANKYFPGNSINIDCLYNTELSEIIQLEGDVTAGNDFEVKPYRVNYYKTIKGWNSQNLQDFYFVFTKDGEYYLGNELVSSDGSVYYIYPAVYDEILGCYITDIIENSNDYMFEDYSSAGYELVSFDKDNPKQLLLTYANAQAPFNSACSEDGKQYAFNELGGYEDENGEPQFEYYVYEAIKHEKFGYIFKQVAKRNLDGLVYEKIGEERRCEIILKENLTINTSIVTIPETVNLLSVKNGDKGVTVSWEHLDNAESYNIYRKADGETKWSKVGSKEVSKTANSASTKARTTTSAKSTQTLSFTDTTAKNGIKYTYTVKAFNSAGAGEYDSTGLSVNYVTAPKPTASVTTSGVKVSWNKISGATSYAVYRKTTGGWTKLGTTKSTSYTDKTAKNNVKYTYTVRAITKKGTSGYYSGATATFLSAPKITSVTNAATGVTVKWGKVSGATVYYVYRKTTGGWTKLGSTKSTSFTDKKAKAGTKYTYTIIAAKSGAKSSYYGGKAIVRLTVPKLTKLTATSKKNTLTYGKVTGATSYIIYRKTGNGGWQKIATTKNTKYVDTKVKKGTYYTYTVRAVRGTSTSYYNTKGLKVRAK